MLEVIAQWSLHPLRFPRYRGTETLEVITAFEVITSCKMLRLKIAIK